MEAECSTNSLSTHGLLSSKTLSAPQQLAPSPHTSVQTHTHTRDSTLSCPLGCALVAESTAHRPRRCHSLVALPIRSACPPNTHMNTVIGRPHVPVNLLIRRHGLRRVPLPPRGWPDLSACQFYSLPRWLLDGLPHLID